MHRFIFFLLLLIFNCYTSKDSVDKSYLAFLMSANHKEMIHVNLIGDSLSERSVAFGLQNKLGSSYQVNDYSVSGRTAFDWLLDISRPFNPIPDIVIIELGTNDAMMATNYDFTGYYNRLISEIQIRSKAKIILTALPITDDLAIQSRIKVNNNFIRSFSNLYTISDLEKAFEDNRSNLRLYPSYDPIHPNPVGYELIGEVYKKDILLIK